MTLKDFLAQYPHISVASEADNQAILNFYHQSAMSAAKSDILYLRGNDFFAFLKERSKSFIVLLMKDDLGEIQGLGVLSFRAGYINGELQTIGYLGDLRVKLNRKLIREWRLMYAQLMKHSSQMEETHHCRYYQTVLIDENLESKNNLAQTKIPHLHYQRLMKYNMVNVIGRLKVYTYQSRLRFAEDTDKKRIEEFLSALPKVHAFAHDWSSELPHRLNSWSNFDLRHLILAEDNNGSIQALSMIWNPVKTKQVKISQIPAGIKILHKVLSFLPLIELKKLPSPDHPLNILYLNQIQFSAALNSEKRKILTRDFLHFAFKEDCHMLAYADFENENFLNGAYSLFSQKMPMALYSVHYKNEDGTINFPLQTNETLAFDMSLV